MTGSHSDHRVLVVGAGMAGLRTAEALRGGGFDGPLVVAGDEEHMPYTRPPLSKTTTGGGPTHEELAFRLKGFEGIDWRLGERVVACDLNARVASLASGEHLGFDSLVAATGVRARRLPISGPQLGRYVVRTLEDAVLVYSLLTAGNRVVIMGAGFIGCEFAATAVKLGAVADVVAIDAVPMQRPLGLEIGAALQKRHEAHGVCFHLGRGIDGVIGDERATGVRLDDGEVLDADLVIEAVGSQCNVEWLDGNGLDLRDGVLADEYLRIDGCQGCYAAGDVARYPNLAFDGTPRRIEHWQLATETGRAAAANLIAELDGEVLRPFTAIPYFWTDQFDFKIQSHGWPGAADRVDVLEGELDGPCAIGYSRGDRLVGAVLIDLPRSSKEYKNRVAASLAVPHA